MINTILFDLDGTLVRFYQDEFLHEYFKRLCKVFAGLGFDAEKASKAVWAGTKAMVLNDGSVLNTRRFWDTFTEYMNIKNDMQTKAEAACDNFYSNEFNEVSFVVKSSDVPKRVVKKMRNKGYTVVLATNPFFPPCAVDSRLSWIGLTRNDFDLITNYENSSFCKPNPKYYHELLSKIGKKPENCLMVGNNPAEDMCVKALGIEEFLVTDYMENEENLDITAFRHGTIEELEAFLLSLPDIAE